MKTMKKMMTLLAVAGLVLALAPAAQAAPITWETAIVINTVGDTLISTEGTLETAMAFQNKYSAYKGDKLINGVTFTSTTGSNNNVAPGFEDFYRASSQSTVPGDPNSNMSAHFRELLHGHAYEDDADGICDIELQGLVAGKSYLVQFLVSDARPEGYATWAQSFSGDETTVAGPYDPRFAYSLVGRFVADATTQAIRIADTAVTGTDAVGNPLISAVQWRHFVPPPAGTVIIIK